MLLINGIEVGQSFALPAVLLLAYEASSRSSLKSWIAVSSLDDPQQADTPEEQERDRKRLRFRKCIGLLAGCAFIAAEIALILKGTPKMIDAFFSLVIGAVLVSITPLMNDSTSLIISSSDLLHILAILICNTITLGRLSHKIRWSHLSSSAQQLASKGCPLLTPRIMRCTRIRRHETANKSAHPLDLNRKHRLCDVVSLQQ